MAGSGVPGIRKWGCGMWNAENKKRRRAKHNGEKYRVS